ncbi:hypothetical protein [Paenibacillus donghaensis]|uniref:hypothetical protein n=1 Tax=Paenibacillus donghaensis TaxID=414771 RepID=UPI001470ABB4|nr:hypothetical protein [Paenibacillus donghaensis]
MLNIAPIKSTPYPTLRSCIDDCIQSVAQWQDKDSKCMYGNAWQMSFEEQPSPDQPLIERLMLPRISTESLSAYHGLMFSYIDGKNRLWIRTLCWTAWRAGCLRECRFWSDSIHMTAPGV